MEKECKQCGKNFSKQSSDSVKYWQTKIYCGLRCCGLSKRGQPSPRKGCKLTPETIKKMSISSIETAVRGDKHWNWKGNNAGYEALHVWLNTNVPKQGVCERCSNKTRTFWANMTGRYLREVREDWAELCYSCHTKEDHQNPKRPYRPNKGLNLYKKKLVSF